MPSPSEYLDRVSVIVVTGGSSGIGRSIIKAISDINPNPLVCNLSRTEPADFRSENGVHLATDLTDRGALASSAAQLEGILDAAPPGEVVWVNNSGFGDYGPSPGLDSAKQLNMIDLNVRAVVDLTHRLLPRLLERGGRVVNIASTAAFQPTPHLATYGATKAFVLHWTLALDEELRGTKLRALAVCPGPTRSNFFRRAGFDEPPLAGGWLDMSSEAVAARVLRALARGRTLEIPGLWNRAIACLGGKAPKVLAARVGGAVLRRVRAK